jgi:hypothetical protein
MGQGCRFPFQPVELLNDHNSEELMRKSASSLISLTKGQLFTLFWRLLMLTYDLASPSSTRRWSTYTLISHMWRCVRRARLATIQLIFNLSQTKCGYACSDQLSDLIALAPAESTLTTSFSASWGKAGYPSSFTIGELYPCSEANTENMSFRKQLWELK